MSADGFVSSEARLLRKGCLVAYGAWVALVAFVAGFVRLTSRDPGDVVSIAAFLLVLPLAVWAGLRYGEWLLARAATRLGLRVRRVSWNEGERPEPCFEAEVMDGSWHFVLMEGMRDGLEVAAYDYTASSGSARGRSGSQALGVIWTLPRAAMPRLVVHGPTRARVLVASRDVEGRESRDLSSLPRIVPGSPVPGFVDRFSSFGENGAATLLSESVQRALLRLPRRSRLLAEGPWLRWELERGGPLSRGLGRRAEELLALTAGLRDAVLEASSLLPHDDVPQPAA